MNILITGATGFIGSFIVEEALRRGMNVWVAIRSSSSLKYLDNRHINFLTLDFDDTTQMANAMKGLSFDYVIHAAGITKSIHARDFHRVNTEGTRHFVEALLAQNVAKAAEILGIERTNLHKKIKKYESNSFDTDESED